MRLDLALVHRIGATTPAPQRSAERYVPYYDHLTPEILWLKDGGAMAMLRLPGVPFALASNAARNGAAARHFALLQLLADRHTEIVEHYASHRHVPPFQAAPGGTAYAAAFARRYEARTLGRLRTREWFLSIIVRPPALGDQWFRAHYRRFRGLPPERDEQVVATLEAKVRTAMAALGRFGAVRLGAAPGRGRCGSGGGTRRWFG